MDEQIKSAVPTTEPAPADNTTPAPEPPKASPLPEEKTVSKELFDKTASEVASLKKQLKERMTSEEIANSQAEEIKTELDALRREKAAAKLEASLAKSGISDSETIAELFAAGDISEGIAALVKSKDKQIAALQKEHTLALQRDAMKPPTGEPNSPFAGKTVAELMQIANTSPEKMTQIFAHIDTLNRQKKE